MALPPLLEARLFEVGASVDLSHTEMLKFIRKGIPQSELFMLEIIPHIHRHYMALPDDSIKSVLDVGPQSFGGTSLIQRLHAKDTFNRLKLEVSAVDIHDKFAPICKILCPEVNFFKGNIYDLAPNSFDFCIASHVVEHVNDPEIFISQLAKVSRDYVMIAAPWEEHHPMSKGHINKIDRRFVESVNGKNLDVRVNYSWGKSRKVCIFTVFA